MKPIYIVYANDLFRFHRAADGRLLSIDVSKGNCNAPYKEIPIDDVPPNVIDQYEDQTDYYDTSRASDYSASDFSPI